MNTKIYYAAYGMNCDPEAMKLRTGTPLPVCPGVVENHAFRFAVHADVYPSPGINTNVMIWQITEDQLASLDLREGYPVYYDRKLVDVDGSDGVKYNAWMYYMTPGNQIFPPSDGYYGMLDRGYTAFGIPKHQIERALAESVVNYAKVNNYPEI